MRLVYFGTSDFAVPTLIQMAPHVVLVVTQPDRPSGRGMQMQPSPVKLTAHAFELPVASPEKCLAPEFVEQVADLCPDALLVAAYGQILSQRLLDTATRGGINLHGSVLPKYRGAAPIQRAILNGDQDTGVTLMQMDKGMDTGDIIAVERHPIGPDVTSGELTTYLAALASTLAAEWMPRIVAGDYSPLPQEESEASYAPKIEKAEAELDTRREAGSEYNRYRAFTPAPGAFMRTRFGILKVTEARLGTNHGSPGVVLSTSDACEVAFTGGSLRLLQVQPEGKKRMSGKDFANGLRLKPGDSLLTHATETA